MSIDTGRAEQTQTEDPQRPPASLTRAELPRWVPWAIFVGSFVVIGGLLALTGSFSIGLFVVGAVVLYALATYVTSRSVEGGRKATDRVTRKIHRDELFRRAAPKLDISAALHDGEEGLARPGAAR